MIKGEFILRIHLFIISIGGFRLKEKKLIPFVKELYKRFKDDDVTALGAQLTYYLILSFFPFLIVLITLLSYTPFTGEKALEDLAKVLPTTANDLVNEVVRQIKAPQREALLPLGTIAIFWAASNGVDALVRGINKAYDQEETRPFWKVKAISLVFTLALIAVIVFEAVLLVFGEAIGKNLFDVLGVTQFFKVVWRGIRLLLPVIFTFLVFTSLFYYMPNCRLKLREVIPGSFFTTAGWIAISLGFSFYINNFTNYSATYGSIGGIIVLLLWLYWSSIIILLGGEINATLAFSRAGRKKPPCKRFGK